MNEWILRICVIGLTTSIILLILPQGKTSKYIKCIFSVLIAVSIFSPLVNSDFFQFDINTNSEQVSILPDNDYLSYFYQYRIKKSEDNVKNLLSSLGILNHEVSINYHIEDDHEIIINKIEINLQNAVFNTDKSHKDIIDEARVLVKRYLSVDEKVVVINE